MRQQPCQVLTPDSATTAMHNPPCVTLFCFGCMCVCARGFQDMTYGIGAQASGFVPASLATYATALSAKRTVVQLRPESERDGPNHHQETVRQLPNTAAPAGAQSLGKSEEGCRMLYARPTVLGAWAITVGFTEVSHFHTPRNRLNGEKRNSASVTRNLAWLSCNQGRGATTSTSLGCKCLGLATGEVKG